MATWIAYAVGVCAIAYLLGSIPSGYLAGRLLKGIDIREHGSKSTGATNVLRTLGKGPALVVLLVDVFKGVLAVLLTAWFFQLPAIATLAPPVLAANGTYETLGLPLAVTLSGLAALLGHSRSIWLNFTGGKSVATGIGVLLAMSLPVGLGALGVFACVLAVSRIVSLGSIVAAIASIVLMVALKQPLPYLGLAIAGGLFVILRHRANIDRLLAGTEPRLGQKKPETES
ncbi:MAG: glycerol-3-phosphate 1-O-acyltransferase PlsY [Oculatellaceae cyanobacterium Prado106]|jgi:glycerol-3-phosphate acyltransferase PlsY|nr:glycerol-3-phosphate 1-O-acyltransferase PlsY [Oculatellaceae cyanobacterium Prado106]